MQRESIAVAHGQACWNTDQQVERENGRVRRRGDQGTREATAEAPPMHYRGAGRSAFV